MTGPTDEPGMGEGASGSLAPVPPGDAAMPRASEPAPPATESWPSASEPMSAATEPGPNATEPWPPASEAIPAAPEAPATGAEPWPPANEPIPPAAEPSPPAVEPSPPAAEPGPPPAAWGAPAAEPEPAPVGWQMPADTPPPTAAPGWVAPAEGSRRGGLRGCVLGCVIVGAILAVLSVAAIVALIFVGTQVQNALKGTVEFGTSGTGCAVDARADSFPAGTNLHFVAYLDRDVSAGETITLVETHPDGTSEPTQQVVDSTASCLFGDLVSGPSTGRYNVDVRVGSDSLAKGGFDVTP